MLWTGNTSTHTSQSGSSRRQNVGEFWRMRITNTDNTGQNKNESPSIRYYSQGSVTSNFPGTETGKTLWHSGKLRIGSYTSFVRGF